MATLSDIIIKAIRAAGGDALCNSDIPCGCSIDDLAICECPNFQECQPAKGRTLEAGEYAGDCGPGDVVFYPLDDTDRRTVMVTERELAHQLFAACRRLLRYDGIDPSRVRAAVDEIREIVHEWIALDEADELDTD